MELLEDILPGTRRWSSFKRCFLAKTWYMGHVKILDAWDDFPHLPKWELNVKFFLMQDEISGLTMQSSRFRATLRWTRRLWNLMSRRIWDALAALARSLRAWFRTCFGALERFWHLKWLSSLDDNLKSPLSASLHISSHSFLLEGMPRSSNQRFGMRVITTNWWNGFQSAWCCSLTWICMMKKRCKVRIASI